MSENLPSNVISVDFGRSSAKARAKADESAAQKKLTLFSEWIELSMVMVIFDARRPGVQVPPALANQCELRLNFSLRFDLKDFVYDEDGISGTLMFPEGLFFCVVPWSAIFAMHSYATNAGVMWPELLPEEFSVSESDGAARYEETKVEPKSHFLKLVTAEHASE